MWQNIKAATLTKEKEDLKMQLGSERQIVKLIQEKYELQKEKDDKQIEKLNEEFKEAEKA